MFVGRKKELKILDAELQKSTTSVLIYGKRKIGKTTLIQTACKKHNEKPFIYFECIKDTEERNVEEMLKTIKRVDLMPQHVSLERKTFIDLFNYLDSLNKEIIVVIDEYPYLKEFIPSKTIDSVFQNIIDNKIKNINLFISGSHIGMMKDLLQEKNALFGRFQKIIDLKELSYLEAKGFYPELSHYDQAAMYAVFGGSPFVNEKINPTKSLMENISDLLLDNSGAVHIYASSLLISDLTNQVQAERIFKALGNGRKSYSELEEILDRNKTGLLSKQLKPLLEMELIKKVAPINRLNDSKKAKYEINDNLLRFYYAYIEPNLFLLNYKDPSIIFEEDIKPSLTQFISYRFEDICREFMWRYVNNNKVAGVVNIGKYYYDDPINKKNGEFDIALLNKDGSVQIIEVKYLKDKVTQSIVNEELSQIRKIENISVNKIGFISINGFDEGITGLNYAFDGNDLYRWSLL